MTTAAPSANPLPDALAGVKVIDCDTHWTEPPDTWTSRAPAKYKDRVPHLKTVNGESRWFIEGDVDFGTVGTTVIDEKGGKLLGKLSLTSFDELHHAAYDPKARTAFMDRLNIHTQIVYPNAAGFSQTKFVGAIKDDDFRLACMQIYNDAAAEFQKDSNNRCLPQALLPAWNRDAMMKEARRCIEDLGLRGFALADRPEAMGMPGFDDAHWTPFWEFCDTKRIPVNFHIGGSAGIDAFSLPWKSFGFERNLAIASTMFYIANAATVANFLLSGLFDKYENLKIVSVESGIGWVPFVLEALEYQFDEMMPNDGKLLKQRPREAFRNHVYACFWFEDFGPRNMIEALGADNILFETDFPHPTCLYPKSQQHIADVLGGLKPEIRQKVLQDNAAALYGIPVS